MMPGTIGIGGRMSQNPLKVTIFGASTGNLGRAVVYELGMLFWFIFISSFSRSYLHGSLQR